MTVGSSWLIDQSKYDCYGEQFNPVERMKTLGVLVPDTRLQAIADADLAPIAALVSELRDLIETKPVAFNSFQWASRFRGRVLALDTLTDSKNVLVEENNDG